MREESRLRNSSPSASHPLPASLPSAVSIAAASANHACTNPSTGSGYEEVGGTIAPGPKLSESTNPPMPPILRASWPLWPSQRRRNSSGDRPSLRTRMANTLVDGAALAGVLDRSGATETHPARAVSAVIVQIAWRHVLCSSAMLLHLSRWCCQTDVAAKYKRSSS